MPYIGKSNDGFGIRERFTYLASGGATTISGADVNARTLAFNDPEYVDVYLNGVRLKMDTDYNLNTTNTVSGLAALSANDEVEVIVHDVFTLADMVSASAGGSFGGAITVKGDLSLTADAAALKFGVDGDVTVTHDTDDGLVFKSTATADDNPFLLTIQTGETDIAANDVLGQINFQAPDEGTGTDAILVAAGIAAISEGDFSSSSNATKLSFQTGASEAASEKMSLSSAGVLTVSGNIVGSGTITGGGLLTTGGDIVIPDGSSIGSASDTNAITISSAGVVTISTNTDSTGAANGALVAHSAGFADDVYIGDFLNVGGDINVVDDLVVNGGVIDLKNTGSQSQLRLYCESSNAHYAALQAPAHSAFSGNTVLTLPATTDTIVGRTTTDTLTNKTLTSPTLNTALVGTSITPASADGATLGSNSAEFSDLFLADGGEILFGADQDVILRHDHNSGLIIDRANTSDNSPTSLTLSTGETDIAADDVIGVINFQAPDEGTGTDAILVAAGIAAISEGDFSASSNATKLSFQTGASEAAAEKMSLSSAGNLTVSGDVSVGDDLALASDGAVMTFGADGEIVLTHVHNSGVQFSDSDKLLFGDGGDLAIYHDGSHSYIEDSGTGSLIVKATDLFLQDASGNRFLAATAGAAVELYHNANAKLTTSSTGVTITGNGTFSSSSSGEFNAITISQADNTSGNESRIQFKRTTDAGSNREVAAIVADREGGNDTALVFEVNTDGADGAVEKARLNHNGTLFVDNVFGLGDTDTGIALGANGSNIMQFYTGNTNRLTINEIGAMINTSQPAFLVHPSGTQSDFPVGSQTQVNFGTERFDQNADFSSNTFTAPATGKYQLSYSMYFNNVDSASNYYQAVLSTSNKAYYAIFSATSLDQDAAYWNISKSLLVDMDVNDTAFLSLQVDGGTAQTDLTVDTYFSGVLVC